jgi:hypothetical protein
VKGPRVVYEYPENCFPSDMFEKVSNYVITEESMSERILSLSTSRTLVVSYPIRLTGAQYGRNALLFTLGLLLSPKSPRTFREEVKPMLAKIGTFAKRLETEREAISSPSKKVWISALLEKLYVNLNSSKRSYFVLDFDDLLEDATSSSSSSDNNNKSRRKGRRRRRKRSSGEGDESEDDTSSLIVDTGRRTKSTVSRIGLYRIPWYTLMKKDRAQEIQNHDVPILLDTRVRTQIIMAMTSSHQTNGKPDLILHRILPLIDGVRYVRKIAEIADVDLKSARQAFGSLLHHGVITKVDIFQFSNVYKVTNQVQELVSSIELQERCVRCVCPDLARSMKPEHSDNTLGSGRHVTKRMFQNIFRTYCAFRGGINVEDVLKSQLILNDDDDEDGEVEDNDDRLDPNRFVVFGVVCGFLRRVHEYPLMSSKAREIAIKSAKNIFKDESQARVVSMFDGTNSMDAICVNCFVSRSTVLRYISSLGSDCIVVPK